MNCFKIVAGIEPFFDDFLVLNFKTSFVTLCSVTFVNSKLFELISGKTSRIFLILTRFLKADVICSM